MISNRRMMRQLDSVDAKPSVKTFGRAMPKHDVRKSVSLPENIIFFNEDTGETYPFNQSGVSQFLRKSGIATVQENVEWMVDVLLNAPFDDTVNLDGHNIGLSFECRTEPRGDTLAKCGITKSMMVKPANRPPILQSSISKESECDIEEEGETLIVLPHGSTFGSGRLVKGKGVLLGMPTMDVMQIKRSEYERNSPLHKFSEQTIPGYNHIQ